MNGSYTAPFLAEKKKKKLHQQVCISTVQVLPPNTKFLPPKACPLQTSALPDSDGISTDSSSIPGAFNPSPFLHHCEW